MRRKEKRSAHEAEEGERALRNNRETKTKQLETMLRRSEGATIAQLVSSLGWQAHTVRAAISAGLRKSKGLAVTMTKETSGERVYRIAH